MVRSKRPHNPYARARRDHTGETGEDYVELIAELIEARGEARTVDLAARLGVTSVTVTKTARRLEKAGLIESEPYRSLRLTARGRRLAEETRNRHRIVVAFLRALGVSAKVAEEDSEGIEHHISAETLACIQRFLARRRVRTAHRRTANGQRRRSTGSP